MKAPVGIHVLDELGLGLDALERVPGITGIHPCLPDVGIIAWMDRDLVELVQRRVADVAEAMELELPGMHTLMDQRLLAVRRKVDRESHGEGAAARGQDAGGSYHQLNGVVVERVPEDRKQD